MCFPVTGQENGRGKITESSDMGITTHPLNSIVLNAAAMYIRPTKSEIFRPVHLNQDDNSDIQIFNSTYIILYMGHLFISLNSLIIFLFTHVT